MFKSTHLLCASLIALSSAIGMADQGEGASDSDFFSSFPLENSPSVIIETSTTSSVELPSQKNSTSSTQTASQIEKSKKDFQPFTGKVKGKKVRLRTQPDLESSIVKELQKGEYLAIVDEIDNFWITEAPTGTKAYVFRSFILDNVVEGNRVNVRLQPSMESPIITHLNSGDLVEGSICNSNHKWLEIDPPKSTRFYISKDYIESVGGPEVKKQHEARLELVRKQVEVAEHFAEAEMKKSYQDIDFDTMNHNFQVVIHEYGEFPEFVEKAKNSLSDLQEKFIDKRISYMESKAAEEEHHAKVDVTSHSITDKMKIWEPIEEALFLSWASSHESRSQDDYQLEQRLAAQRIVGILEPYTAPIKCKPGDFILKNNDLPVGYVYSTSVNLQDLVGKKVSLIGSPRPNNHFAFPAYFILGVEEQQ